MNSRTRTPFGNSPPEECHVELTADKLKPGRVIIIGDVHGCLDELNALLEKCEYEPEVDNLILAGDVVNKGPQSVQALRRARELKAWVVRGNHEDACVALKRRLSIVATLSPNYRWLKELNAEDVDFMQRLPFTISLPSHNALIVHAGLVPNGKPLREQTMKDMLFLEEVDQNASDASRFKCYYKERPGWQEAAWARFWQGPEHVFFGHASKEKAQEYKYATGLDSRCVHGGKLTACILPPAAKLATHEPFQDYLKNTSGKRPPMLKELGAELVEVPSRQQGQLEPVLSADFCSEQFSQKEQQASNGMAKMPSGPVPDTKPPSAQQGSTLLNRVINLTR